MTDRFAQVILPQPGDDWKTYALALNAQLTRVIQQLARIQSTDLGTNGSSTLPIRNSSGRLIIDADGNIVDENGNIIIDATGLHVLDINDFKWIDGPNVYINTEKLVDNAVTTAKLAAQAVTADKFYGNLEPIEIVTVLPNPVGYTGPSIVIFEGKVYRYYSGAWVVNVDTSDLTGTITSTQIDDDSISTPKIQANAVKAAQIDAEAVITDKLDAGAVTAAKLAAYSVVAGKIAANAIVAGDAVIGAAAIVDAMIANLNASKIHAGDIAAQRMEANIVTALVGKFAVLSAIVSILGTVTVGASGYLRTQGVTSFTAGTGVYLGDDGAGTYVFRVGSTSMQFKWDGTKLVIGNPTGARWEFSGTSGTFYGASGNVILASGTTAVEILNSQQVWSQVSGAADLGNLIPDVDFADPTWVLPTDASWSIITPWFGLPGAKALRYDEQTITPLGTFISGVVLPSALNASVTPGETIYWSYWRRSDAAANGYAGFYLRYYDAAGAVLTEVLSNPALPQVSAGQWSGSVVVPALAVKLGFRVRRSATAGGVSTNGWVQWSQIRLSRTQDGATVGADIGTNLTRSGTSVLASEFVASWNKLSEGNAATFMSTAAITSAYIKDAAILSAKIQDGAITTAKIGDAQVNTLQIGTNAVTVPLYSEVAATAYASRGTYQVTIGSITTSSAGQGNVIVMVFPRGPFPDLSVSYAYVAAAIAHRYSGSSGTHYLRLLRVVGASTTEVWRWEYTSAPSSSTTFAEGPVIFDAPGPGVSVVYKLESGGPTGPTMMKPLSVVLLEAKK